MKDRRNEEPNDLGEARLENGELYILEMHDMHDMIAEWSAEYGSFWSDGHELRLDLVASWQRYEPGAVAELEAANHDADEAEARVAELEADGHVAVMLPREDMEALMDLWDMENYDVSVRLHEACRKALEADDE